MFFKYRHFIIIGEAKFEIQKHFKKTDTENESTQKYDFERRLCAQTQDLQIFKKFYMSQMNLKEFVHNTAIPSSTTLHSRSVPLNNLRNKGRARVKKSK